MFQPLQFRGGIDKSIQCVQGDSITAQVGGQGSGKQADTIDEEHPRAVLSQAGVVGRESRRNTHPGR